jgi:hypothetical protein
MHLLQPVKQNKHRCEHMENAAIIPAAHQQSQRFSTQIAILFLLPESLLAAERFAAFLA